MFYCLDRIEDGTAYLIDDAGNVTQTDEKNISPGAREGETVVSNGGVYVTDHAETARRREIIKEKFRKLTKEQ